MDITEYIYKNLLLVQRRHTLYFLKENTDVYDCVRIIWAPLELVILKHDLPEEIKGEIEDIVSSMNNG